MSGRHRKKVLIIDDNADTQMLLSEWLNGEWTECVAAFTPTEGFDKIRELKPQLIILDLMLPEMSGFGFLRELRNHSEFRGIPVVVLTSLGDQEVADEAMDLGAVGFLRKNCGRAELLTMVGQYAA